MEGPIGVSFLPGLYPARFVHQAFPLYGMASLATTINADAARPLIASSNYDTNQIINGPFTTGLSAAGQFKVYTSATTDLIIDVLGYYSADAVDANGTGLLFMPLAHPVRLL